VVHLMLSNAVIAAVLAFVALAVGFFFRSPRVRHAAWLIVLLKLVTPPVFSVPITVPATSWMAPAAEPPDNHSILLSASAADTSRSLNYPVPRPPGMWEWLWTMRVIDVAVLIWVLGAIAWFGWQGRRIIRFHRRVANAEHAPADVVTAAGNIARTLGIIHPPEVKVATGIGSPMLWGRGRSAVILFPRELLARLSQEARDTLLAHELAHFLRGDHLVRVLEFFSTGLYWWHPAVWLARRGIEAAEEECCDAWVVAGLAASARRYAEALLETVNFEAELRRPRLPPGACAASRSARLLHHRLTQIIHARPPRRVRGRALLWLLVAAALLTRPVLRAATPELPEPAPTPTAASKV
jgi:bla regulator protein BlaR1